MSKSWTRGKTGVVLFIISIFSIVFARAEPATQSSLHLDWPAFHGGGALSGEAAPIAPPPMKLRWTYRTREDEPVGVVASAAIVGNAAYVADQGGTLHAIDLTTGKALWTYKSKDGFETSPLVRASRVMLGDVGGIFHAISATDGKVLWTFDSGASIHASANAVDGAIVFGNDGAEIFCLSAEDGKVLWRQKAGDRLNSAPAISGTVFISGCDAMLRSLAVADGAEQAAIELSALCPGSPAIVDGKIVLGTDGGVVQCFELGTNKHLWSFEGVGNSAMVYSSPAVSQGIVVVGARDRKVYGLDLSTGEKKWSFSTRGDVDSSPAISDGRVYVGSNDKRLYVLNLKTGEKLWDFLAGRAISASPAIGQGVVVFGDEAGTVYCLEPER